MEMFRSYDPLLIVRGNAQSEISIEHNLPQYMSHNKRFQPSTGFHHLGTFTCSKHRISCQRVRNSTSQYDKFHCQRVVTVVFPPEKCEFKSSQCRSGSGFSGPQLNQTPSLKMIYIVAFLANDAKT